MGTLGRRNFLVYGYNSLKGMCINPVSSRCASVKLVTEVNMSNKDTYFSIANMRYGVVRCSLNQKSCLNPWRLDSY